MTRSARGPAITRFWRIARHPLLIAAVLAALLALFALALLYPAGPDGRPSEALIRRADVKSIQAHIQATLEKNRVEDDQPNTFQITVSNNSPKPLNPPLLSLDAPGFALDQKALVCRDASGGADADFEKLFFHLLLLLKHMEVFRLKEGGVFFKRRDGEKAMTAAWYLLKTTSYRGLGGDEIVAKALEKVKCDWDYATYKAALPGPELQAVWTKFQEWRKVAEDSADAESLWQILGVIDAFQAIASFEADFALKYWYEGANQERDPKAKLFMLQGKTEIYYRKTHDPQDLAHTLQDQLQTLYQREVETKPIN